MPRETKDQKALRFIRDHRIRVTELTTLGCVAEVAGDTGDYVVQLDGRWGCSCEHGCNTKALCSHVLAVQTVYRAVIPALRRA